MKEILIQFTIVWRSFKPFQRLTLLSVLIFVTGSLGFLIVQSARENYILLFPKGHLQKDEVSEVRYYLEHLSIPFKEKKNQEILVPEEYADTIRMELSTSGILKQNKGKGFELFDTNTWIKGEKELQVLEMRALKGQLEKDLSGYENIKNASVILDLAPPRSFGNTPYKTKASVILTLMPNSRLSNSQLRAITNHLAGAVRGLEPNMVAISDTTGRLYKAIDPEKEDSSHSQIALEEELQSKIDGMLMTILGKDHFYTTVHASYDKERGEVNGLSFSVLLDQTLFNERDDESLQTQIQNQLSIIMKGYGVPVESVISFIQFEKKKGAWIEKKEKGNYIGLIFTFFIVLLFLLALFPLLSFYSKKREKSDDEALFKVMTRVDLEKLSQSIQGEDPETIAMMLSYLEPKRAEQMIASFPENFQEKVLHYLSEFEKE